MEDKLKNLKAENVKDFEIKCLYKFSLNSWEYKSNKVLEVKLTDVTAFEGKLMLY